MREASATLLALAGVRTGARVTVLGDGSGLLARAALAAAGATGSAGDGQPADVVIAVLDGDGAALADAARALRPGGRLAAAATAGDLPAWLAEAGFQVLHVVRLGADSSAASAVRRSDLPSDA